MAGGRMFVETSAAVSWRFAKMAQVRLEAPAIAGGPVTVGGQVKWQDLTQLTFFGEGPESDVLARSEYRLQSTAAFGYVAVRLAPGLVAHGRAGWLSRPELGEPAGTFQRGFPPTRQVFASDPVFARAQQPSFLHGELALVFDRRDAPGHPTRGGVYRGSWARYAERDAGDFRFDRFEAEGAHFVPLAGGLLVLSGHGWIAGTSGDGHVPFYLQPNLGGNAGLRGYANYRFHDRSLMLANVEARLALFPHADLALFADAGSVAARVGDLNLSRRSYGAGLRLHTGHTTLVRFDAGRSVEGWRFLFSATEPFRFKRATPRLSVVPF
jgi:hypothetical protein